MLAILNEAINAYLQLDPTSLSRLKKLEKKAILIELLPFNYFFYVELTDNKIILTKDSIYPIAATIRGTPLQMTAVMIAKDNRHQFFAEDIKIEGDAEIAQSVINLFDELQIDWEEYLSQLVGDVPSHHIGRFAKSAMNWLKKSKNTLRLNISDYLQEEIKCYPPKEEVENFYHEVDELRMAVDRLEARLRSVT